MGPHSGVHHLTGILVLSRALTFVDPLISSRTLMGALVAVSDAPHPKRELKYV